jgi:ABC-type hemin transport system ATPase subunit
MQHIDTIGLQTFGGDLQRVLSGGHQSAFDAVRNVGQLHPAVSDGTSTMLM